MEHFFLGLIVFFFSGVFAYHATFDTGIGTWCVFSSIALFAVGLALIIYSTTKRW